MKGSCFVMSEKRFKVIIDKQGNPRIKTISGFAGDECNATADQIMACINGQCVKSGTTDDYYREEKPNVFVVD